MCRLAVTVSRLPGLRELDIANNDLGMLPESVFELPALEQLDISGKLWYLLPALLFRLTVLSTRSDSRTFLSRCSHRHGHDTE